ncbi:hypothetical protein GUJ93_ZPchr0012g19853 [Zizania palustris]|uniref:Uncharacterized protein n=1 Tax=Zizania palustris TaxID=103762 RepID=A0A8J5WX84_ZIZPA|nr:hypothetical protein GUJ93_ZPchr0012g19853 [Zizania palustris]
MSGLGDRGTSSSAMAVLPPAAACPAAGLQCAKRGQDEVGVAEVFGEMPPQLTEILFSQCGVRRIQSSRSAPHRGFNDLQANEASSIVLHFQISSRSSNRIRWFLTLSELKFDPCEVEGPSYWELLVKLRRLKAKPAGSLQSQALRDASETSLEPSALGPLRAPSRAKPPGSLHALSGASPEPSSEPLRDPFESPSISSG